MSEKRYIYDLSEGDATMRNLLGGKGAGVAEMARVGVPVPDAFTVTTTACVETMNRGGEWPDGLADEINAGLTRLEERTGRKLGGSENPLLVSVRSGAVFSMPGMMDTILNLGVSDESVAAIAEESGNERFAWDCYRRFIQMYGEVVGGLGGVAVGQQHGVKRCAAFFEHPYHAHAARFGDGVKGEIFHGVAFLGWWKSVTIHEAGVRMCQQRLGWFCVWVFSGCP